MNKYTPQVYLERSNCVFLVTPFLLATPRMLLPPWKRDSTVQPTISTEYIKKTEKICCKREKAPTSWVDSSPPLNFNVLHVEIVQNAFEVKKISWGLASLYTTLKSRGKGFSRILCGGLSEIRIKNKQRFTYKICKKKFHILCSNNT